MAARVAAIKADKAQGEVKQTLESLQKKLGKVPNIFQHMANSPAVLNAYFSISDALEKTSFDSKVREEIALAVSQANHCQYCLSAHTTIGQKEGLSQDQIVSARKGQSKDKKTQAILRFTKAVVDKKGFVMDQDVNDLKAAGVSDRELVELILVIQGTMFTNYFNHIVNTEVDFPQAATI